MKIFYRGYIISQEESSEGSCTVEGRRPERSQVAIQRDPRSAMRWVDHDVIRHRVAEAGWLNSGFVSV